MNPKTSFKWLFMYIIPYISSKILTKDTTLSNYLLIADAYSKLPRLYGMENITTEEIMDKLDMFQAILGKLDKLFWWDMEIIQSDAGMQFTSKEFQEGLYVLGLWLVVAALDHK